MADLVPAIVESFAKVIATASVVTRHRDGSMQFAWPIENVRSWLAQQANARLIRSVAPRSVKDATIVSYIASTKPQLRFFTDDTLTHEVEVTLENNDRTALILMLAERMTAEISVAQELHRRFQKLVYIHPEELLRIQGPDGQVVVATSTVPIINEQLVGCLNHAKSWGATQVVSFKLALRRHGRTTRDCVTQPRSIKRTDSLKAVALREVRAFINNCEKDTRIPEGEAA